METNEVAMTRASVATDFIMVMLEAEAVAFVVVVVAVVVVEERRMVGRKE